MNRFRYPDARQAAEACGREMLELLDEAIRENGVARIAISGGSSPRPMFEMLARTPFDWDKVQLFFVDERGVSPDDPQSNFKFANETWLTPAKFPRANVHRIPAELDPQEAAARYAGEIRSVFGLAEGELPRFDVIHQGMGPDGHTASLFPGEPLIEDRMGVVAAVWVEKFHQWRITLLPGVLLASRATLMLVTGADKTAVLKNVLEGSSDPKTFPCKLVANKEIGVFWFLDEAAAALLN